MQIHIMTINTINFNMKFIGLEGVYIEGWIKFNFSNELKLNKNGFFRNIVLFVINIYLYIMVTSLM
jgi:hypothetical protein